MLLEVAKLVRSWTDLAKYTLLMGCDPVRCELTLAPAAARPKHYVKEGWRYSLVFTNAEEKIGIKHQQRALVDEHVGRLPSVP
ncbi:unnamed protein product [Toxocara canis]|uniref:Transposase n=1 Tax=Toxocara canis TaxID=6265 RepID=A0A183TUW9_TOXCA|nr:unnamed protein product [Toxocara canis]